METPHTIVVVGEKDGNQANLHTQLEPVRLEEEIGIAVTSIYHGEVFNIHEGNNKIHYHCPDVSKESIERFKESSNFTDDQLQILEFYRFPQRDRVCEIPVGYYPSVISILGEIERAFEKEVRIYNHFNLPVGPPEFSCKLKGNGFIECYSKNISIIVGKSDSPWSLLKIFSNFLWDGEIQRVMNHEFAKDLEPAFMYVNIVENSYINGKLSRVLSVIPIRMKADWSHHEFTDLNFVPINVREFSKITISIKDMNGNDVKFNPKFSTIITLQTQAINRPW